MISVEDSNRFADCNGRHCGTGRHIGGGHYVCSHNNLKVKRPDLMPEWDYEKNTERPENLFPKSNKYAWWICPINPCGCHKYQSLVSDRTTGYGCPYCRN